MPTERTSPGSIRETAISDTSGREVTLRAMDRVVVAVAATVFSATDMRGSDRVSGDVFEPDATLSAAANSVSGQGGAGRTSGSEDASTTEVPANHAYPAEEHSFQTFDAAVDAIVQLVGARSIIDIGAGAGKYGRRLRQVVPDATLIAVEMNADDIREHALHSVYDRIIQHDVSELMVREPNFACDVAILGDVIEHLPKSSGIDLLNWLHYRAAYTIIITPEHMALEAQLWFLAHNSLWSARDFGWHDNWASDQLVCMQLFVLRGVRGAPISLNALVDSVNEMKIPIAFQEYNRACSLRLRQIVNNLEISERNHLYWRPL